MYLATKSEIFVAQKYCYMYFWQKDNHRSVKNNYLGHKDVMEVVPQIHMYFIDTNIANTVIQRQLHRHRQEVLVKPGDTD